MRRVAAATLVLAAAIPVRTAHIEITVYAFDPPTLDERRRAIGPTDGLPPALRDALVEAAFRPIPEPLPGDWLATQRERPQTVRDFVTSNPNRPNGRRSRIDIVPLGTFPSSGAPSLDLLERFASAFFGVEARTLRPLALDGLRIRSRMNGFTHDRQLLTTDVLRVLGERIAADAFCLLGVTMTDLYPDESWNFVFGQASLRDRVGVYSFARYDPTFRGEPSRDDGRIVLLRAAKVLAHETGHMFGLDHCTFYLCLMNGSNHMDESDSRPLHLCPVCLRKLQWSVRFDVVARYERLRTICREAGLDDEARFLDGELARMKRSSG